METRLIVHMVDLSLQFDYTMWSNASFLNHILNFYNIATPHPKSYC